MLSYPIESAFVENVSNTVVDFPIVKLRYHGFITNGGAAGVWLQIFFKPAAEVTLGTTKPDDRQFVPATGAARFLTEIANQGAPRGLSLAVTATETGNGAPANNINVGIYYEGM